MKFLTLVLLSAFVLAGCFEFDTVVRVNPDGTGTVEQTVLMNKQTVRELRELSLTFRSPSGEPAKEFDMMDRERLFADAQKLGRGVRFSSAHRLFTRDKEGYTVYYRFDDINTLSINQNPGDKQPGSRPRGSAEPPQEPVTFSLVRGTPSSLMIRLPEDRPKPRQPAAQDPDEDAGSSDTTGLSRMMQMFKGFRLSLSILVNGRIVGTTASNVDSNRVTLMAFDADLLLRNPGLLNQLRQNRAMTVEEGKRMLKNIPGFRVELERETMVQFR